MVWVTDWNLYAWGFLFACFFFFFKWCRELEEFEWHRTKFKKVILLVENLQGREMVNPLWRSVQGEGCEWEGNLSSHLQWIYHPPRVHLFVFSSSLSVKVKGLNWFLLLKVSEGSPRKSLVKFRKNFKKGRIISPFLIEICLVPLCVTGWREDLIFSKWFHEMRMGTWFSKIVQLREIRV